MADIVKQEVTHQRSRLVVRGNGALGEIQVSKMTAIMPKDHRWINPWSGRFSKRHHVMLAGGHVEQILSDCYETLQATFCIPLVERLSRTTALGDSCSKDLDIMQKYQCPTPLPSQLDFRWLCQGGEEKQNSWGLFLKCQQFER